MKTISMQAAAWFFVVNSALAAEADINAVCQSPRTSDIEACLKKELESAQGTMDRYLSEIRRMWSEQHEDMAALDAAQKAWLAFLEADCQAVYQHWIEGTIRGAQFLGCKLAHTKSRTCGLWLTYLDHMATGLRSPCEGAK